MKDMTRQGRMSPSGRRMKTTLEPSLRGRPVEPRTIIGAAHKVFTAFCIFEFKASVASVALVALVASVASVEPMRSAQRMASRVDGPYFRTKERVEADL